MISVVLGKEAASGRPSLTIRRPARRPPAGYRLGVEFDSAQINQALAAPARMISVVLGKEAASGRPSLTIRSSASGATP